MISDELFQKFINHSKRLTHESFVVPNAIPIPYFGDSEAYKKSSLKIVTVGLNPSDAEFNQVRFKIDDYNKFSIPELKLCLDDYFKHNPYSGWFNSSYERLLQSFNCSYYAQDYFGKKRPDWIKVQGNRALHTDLCSPLATEPTWSKLDVDQQCKLMEEGKNLWHLLIKELEPDIILASFRKAYLPLLLASDLKEHEIEQNKRPFKFKTGRLGDSKIVFGTSGQHPFSPLRKEHCGKIAKKVLR